MTKKNVAAHAASACAALLALAPAAAVAAAGGTSPVILRFTASPEAILFTPRHDPSGDVAYLHESRPLPLPPAPPASVMSTSMLENRYAPAAATLAASQRGDLVSVGARAGGNVYLMDQVQRPGSTPIFGVKPEQPHRTFHVTERHALALQKRLRDGDHAAAYALLEKLMDGAKPHDDAASNAQAFPPPAAGPLGIDAPDRTAPFESRFALIPAGAFKIGSPKKEIGRSDNETQRAIRIPAAFALQRWQTTQGEFLEAMDYNPSGFKEDDGNEDHRIIEGRPHNVHHPVTDVSWYDGIAYANRRSELDGLALAYRMAQIARNRDGSIKSARVIQVAGANGYLLVPEEEWEYAARAGTKTPYPFPETELNRRAWQAGNDIGRPRAVATKDAGPWGLYDMIGNVWEWTNSLLSAQGPNRVIRGGSYIDAPRYQRAAFRFYAAPGDRFKYLGIRLMRRLPD